MKKIFIIALFLCTLNLYSEFNNFEERVGQVEFSINIPSYNYNNGKVSSSKIIDIIRQPQGSYLQNQIIIKTKSSKSFIKNKVNSTLLADNLSQIGTSQVEVVNILKQEILEKNNDKFGLKKVRKITYNNPIDVYEACKILMSNPDIEYACPIYVDKPSYEVNDPDVNKQWFVKKIGLDKAWDVVKGSKDVVIAIVDSGIDWTHEDLQDNIWTNENEIPDNGIDDDENGFIDDIHGWDFVGNVDANQIYAGQYQPDNDTKPTANGGNTHGTHVAGCAAAVNDNEIGLTGSSFNCSILPIKIGTDNYNSYPYLPKSWDGVQYAMNMGVQIINCSWGGYGYSPWAQNIVDQAYDLGIAIVAASGNDNNNNDVKPHYPSSYNHVLSVGATQSNDRRSGFSNYGNVVDVFAPGSGIRSTLPYNKYGNSQGTSMASPVCAGVIGLIRTIRPSWDVDKVFAQIRATCDPVSGVDENDRPIIYGRINAYKAVTNNINPNSEKVPGIYTNGFEFDGISALSEFNKITNLKLKLVNKLEQSGKLVINITPIDYFINVEKEVYNLPNFLAESEIDLDLEVSLKDNTPWYSGGARLLITYSSSSGYKNYEFVDIPIELDSDNIFKVAKGIDENPKYQWYDSYSSGENDYYFVGVANGYSSKPGAVFTNSSSDAALIRNGSSYVHPVTSVCATESGKTFISTSHSSNGTTTMYSLSGTNATPLANTSSITPFINKVYFFDDSEGIIIGDPKDGTYGIARTTDGGSSWNKPNINDTPESGETFLVGCGSGYGDKFICGTSKGRVLLTKSKGKSWSSNVLKEGAYITSMFLSDDNSAMAIYNDTEGLVKLSYSTNGGSSWNTNIKDFNEEGITPIQIWSPELSGTFFVFFSTGQIYKTSDGGKTYQPVYSSKLTTYQKIAGLQKGSESQIVQINSELLATTTFPFLPEDGDASFEINEEEEIFVFDSVAINKLSRGTVILNATGNVEPRILSAEIEVIDAEDGDFTYFTNNKDVISLDKDTKLTVLFKTQTAGLKTAKLNLITNGEPKNLSFDLKAYAFDPESVLNDFISGTIENINVNPNPVNKEINLEFNLLKYSNIKIELIDEKGNLLKLLKNNTLLPNHYQYTFETNNISHGMYFIAIHTDFGTITKKIIKE